MKYLFCILLLSFLFIKTNGQTNSYHPFPDSNARWLGSCFDGGVFPPASTGGFNYSISNKDTVINSLLYKMVNGSTNFIALRQDIVNKKVFAIHQAISPSEFLLYDFDLQINDTFIFRNVYVNSCDKFTTLDYIDSINIGGQFRKKYNFNGGIEVIEGIGSKSGLFYKNCFEGFCVLCYYDDSTYHYQNSSTFCDPTSTNELVVRKNISIYPNPFKDHLEIKTKENISFSNVQLWNVYGEQLKEWDNLNTNDLRLDIGYFSKGIYFLNIQFEDNTSLNKKILID